MTGPVIDNFEKPRVGDYDVLIKVEMTGINPIDHVVVSGALPKIEPIPCVPGAESSGIVEEIDNMLIIVELRKGTEWLSFPTGAGAIMS